MLTPGCLTSADCARNNVRLAAAVVTSFQQCRYRETWTKVALLLFEPCAAVLSAPDVCVSTDCACGGAGRGLSVPLGGV
jgi:hypothetical protein